MIDELFEVSRAFGDVRAVEHFTDPEDGSTGISILINATPSMRDALDLELMRRFSTARIVICIAN